MPPRHAQQLLLLLLLLATSLLGAAAGAAAGSPATAARARVILDHDGGVDDMQTLLLLLAQRQRVELLGVTILAADCVAELAVNTTLKLLSLLDHADVPVALSTLQGANPFPLPFRAQGLAMDVLPLLNRQPAPALAAARRRQLVAEPGQHFLGRLLMQQAQPVTLIVTGPLSNLAFALQQHGEALAAKVERVWWMGGALRVPGNVHVRGSDGRAEWNAFWDPPALGAVWASRVPLTMVALDGTNQVPITPELIYALGPQSGESLYSQLAGTLWANVVTWVYVNKHEGYFAWDVSTAMCWLFGAQLCRIEDGLATQAVLSGPSQGATVLAGGSQQQRPAGPVGAAVSGGAASSRRLAQQQAGERSAVKVVSAVVDIDPGAFQSLLLASLRV